MSPPSAPIEAPSSTTPARRAGPTGAAPNVVRDMSRAALMLSVLTLVASAINGASNLVFSRILPPASYGDLTALLALCVVVTVPTAAAQTRLAERIAAHSAAGDTGRVRYLIRHALGHLVTIAAVATVLYIVLIPLVESALDLRAVGPAIALAPLILLSFLFPLPLGILQGMGRFVAF